MTLERKHTAIVLAPRMPDGLGELKTSGPDQYAVQPPSVA